MFFFKAKTVFQIQFQTQFFFFHKKLFLKIILKNSFLDKLEYFKETNIKLIH